MEGTCPYCREPASGRFCSSCGKELAISHQGRSVARDLFGLKLPPVKSILWTAWLAAAQPEVLSQRWVRGDRQGLTSPVAMMSIVGAVAAFVAAALTNLTGHDVAAADAEASTKILAAAPFLAHLLPGAFRAASANPDAFAAHFRQVGAWFVAFWPALFLAPGLIVLAPWRRLSRHDALILACVETVFIMILTGVYSALRIAAPGFGGWLGFLLWLLLVWHSARHIRRAVPESGPVYAVTRPLLATLLFPIVIYLWVVGVMAITLMLGTTLR